MSQDLAPIPTSLLPAPLSVEWSRQVSYWLTKLDPEGADHSIAQVDAPSAEHLSGLRRRSKRLADCLAPAGQMFVVRLIGTLSVGLKKRPRSPQEADVAMKQLVDGLADLPMFALEAAAKDFLNGTHGDGWMPDLSDIRPHAVSKVQAPATERRNIDKIVGARVRGPVDESRKARLLAEVRAGALKTMGEAGLAAEVGRLKGRQVKPDRLKEAMDRRAEAETAARPLLSDEAVSAFRIIPETEVEEASHG